MKNTWFLYLVALIAYSFLLAGCSTLNNFFNYGLPTPTITPLPSNQIPTSTISANSTLAPNEFRVIESQVCPITTFDALRAETTQIGSLAWKPGSDGIAYIAPRSDQLWYNGDLVLASGSNFATHIPLTNNLQVVGDLLWSPDGASIAFVAFRPVDNVYTVMVTRENGTPIDLFPDLVAHTDKFSSPKTLLHWQNNDSINVAVTCGVNCEQSIDINVTNGTPSPVAGGQPTAQPVQMATLIPAAVATDQVTYDPNLFPAMTDPTWSPDGKLVAYLNDNGDPWLLSIKDRTFYPLDVNNALVVEMQWSPDGKMIALHLDGSIEIFKIGCTAS